MLSVYNYTNALEYLNDYFSHRKQTDPAFSLNRWAHGIGLKSAAPIVDILRGEKNLKPSLVEMFIGHIGLDRSEYSYFLALVMKTRSLGKLENSVVDLLLHDLNPKAGATYEVKRFEDDDIFSHWIFTAILGMSALKDFELSPPHIQKNLREHLPLELIEAALERLITVGLLEKKNGKLVKKYDSVSTKTDKKHHSVAHYYEQVSDLSKGAISLPLEKREFQSFSLAIKKEDIPLAKEIIRKCRAGLSALSTREGEVVYQTNLFFFPLTHEQESKKVRTSEEVKGV